MGEKRNRNIWRIINLLSETQIERTDIKKETERERERERKKERERETEKEREKDRKRERQRERERERSCHLKEHVRVADLKYGHDEISSTYLHGPQAGQRLGTLHFELMNGIKRVSDLDPLIIMGRN